MKSTVAFCLLFFLLAQHGASAQQPGRVTNNAPRRPSTPAADSAGWQTIRWEKQGVTLTFPPGWRKDESISSDEEKRNEFFTVSYFALRGPSDQTLEASVETGAHDFPLPEQMMLEQSFETDQKLRKDGKAPPVEESRYLELNGVRGVYTRVAYGGQRVQIFWQTFRYYQGKPQNLFLSLSGTRNQLATLTKVLNSARLTHDHSSDVKFERPVFTPAQRDKLAGGQRVKWEGRGMSFSLPKGLSQSDFVTEGQFRWEWPDGASFLADVITYQKEPAQMKYSLERDYSYLLRQLKEKVEGVRYLELGGLKGIEWRFTNDLGDGDVLSCLKWSGYRVYRTKPQIVNLELCSPREKFAEHRDEFHAVLYSTELTQN